MEDATAAQPQLEAAERTARVAKRTPGNIVIVADTARREGGSSVVAVQTALGLAARGERVRFLAGPGAVAPEVAEIDVRQFDAAPAGGLARAMRLMANPAAEAWCKRELGDLDPRETVVHVHSYREVLSPSVFRAFRKLGLATVYTSHDYSLGCPRGGFYDYRRKRICRLRGLSAGCWMRNCTTHSMLRKTWTCAKHTYARDVLGFPKELDAVVFVSEFSRRVLEPYLGRRTKPFVVRNPCAPKDSKLRSTGDAEGIVFVGRLSEEKDPITVALAARELGEPATFVGEGPLLDDVRAILPHALYTGWVDAEAARTAMRRAKVLVLASRLYETQGMVVDEAAAEGVAAVVPEAGAAAVTVLASGGGCLFREGDVPSLVEALRGLLQDDEWRAAGQRARDHFWLDPPTMERYTKDLMSVYAEVLTARYP